MTGKEVGAFKNINDLIVLNCTHYFIYVNVYPKKTINNIFGGFSCLSDTFKPAQSIF